MKAAARTRRLALAASVLFLSGCVSTSFHPAPGFAQREGPPVSPESVLLLSSAPSRPYVALGEIEAWISGFPSNDTALRKTREAAAAVGAGAGRAGWAAPPGPSAHSRRPCSTVAASSWVKLLMRSCDMPAPGIVASGAAGAAEAGGATGAAAAGAAGAGAAEAAGVGVAAGAGAVTTGAAAAATAGASS